MRQRMRYLVRPSNHTGKWVNSGSVKPLTLRLIPLILVVASCTSTRSATERSAVTVAETPAEAVTRDIEDSPSVVELVPDDALLSTLPRLNREFRGAWVATVDNIDWPTAPALTTATQQAEMRAILDRAVELKLNAIVFQVRPTADALYASDLEPWSAYLTGRQGEAPDPFYDPLQFTLEEAHNRGLEVHAWVNPFRAYHPTAVEQFDESHVALRDFSVVYGAQRWMDPGNSDAVEHSSRVVRDIVARYDIDGVHMDDYFYPYPVQGQSGDSEPFPDDASWEAYQRFGGRLTIPDWRRQNVDRFIERVYREIKELKPWVKFGISPFGIWRPGHPEGIVGFDAYNGLYADARKWLTSGWLDYLSPQLYWAMDSEGQSYPLLLDWWIDQNVENRHIWPGNFTSRIILEESRYWDAPELIRQIRHTQETEGAGGNVHFSMKALMPADHTMGDQLLEEAYSDQALIPSSPWLGGQIPSVPDISVSLTNSGYEASFTVKDGPDVWLWAVRTLVDGAWVVEFVPANRSVYVLPTGYRKSPPEAIAVSAIERTGLEGRPMLVRLSGSISKRKGW